jgi:hypothetical protein
MSKPLLSRIASGEFDVVKTPGKHFNLSYSKNISTDGVEIFVLSDELSLAAQTLLNSPENVVPNDLSTLRLPYNKIAIELKQTEEVKALRRKQSSTKEDDPSLYPISVTGMLITAYPEHGNTITIQSYWEYEGMNSVEVSMICLILNAHEAIKRNTRTAIIKYPFTTLEVAVLPSPYIVSRMLDKDLPSINLDFFKDPDILSQLIKESSDELTTNLFAALMLINCKSGVSATRISGKTLSPAFSKKLRKKLSSPSYTVLSISESESVTPTGVVSRRSDISAHYVRGHFKCRRGGTYWWNPYIRGKGEVRKREAYRVVA